jgi:tetratricopeptide (TPR) repeat protein
MVAYLAGEWETAVGWYNLALQIDETDGLTHYWLGLAYQYQGDNPVQALTHYDRALADLLDDGPPPSWPTSGKPAAAFWPSLPNGKRPPTPSPRPWPSFPIIPTIYNSYTRSANC